MCCFLNLRTDIVSAIEEHCSAIISTTHYLYFYFTTGLKTIEGELVLQGVRVQQRRIRESVKRVDPVGRRLRTINALRRLLYNVR